MIDLISVGTLHHASLWLSPALVVRRSGKNA